MTCKELVRRFILTEKEENEDHFLSSLLLQDVIIINLPFSGSQSACRSLCHMVCHVLATLFPFHLHAYAYL